jgi:hypothetical protein
MYSVKHVGICVIYRGLNYEMCRLSAALTQLVNETFYCDQNVPDNMQHVIHTGLFGNAENSEIL